ncbi:endoplasmic reticulum vesicle transporter-domain-containing protein [Limtongia smithiae]|uniref:endoplasmic reticulum vesicle transporter-domain-containing protein n=1 Tax=Limtongia smithiae TaxID=1125753 RepID=UPI0034CD30DA
MCPMDNIAKNVRTFDAFPKVSSMYSTRSSQGGATTLFLAAVCLYLIWTEMGTYFAGVSDQQFLVTDAVGWDMQVNVDITVAMPCTSLHVNAQDAAGDRLLAGELLTMEPTTFDLAHTHTLSVATREESQESMSGENVQNVLRRGKVSRRFKHTPPRRKGVDEACRIYGMLDVNKVQGDLHITAKNFGYLDRSDPGKVLRREDLNFSHVIDELSFGEYYPSLENPLDGVAALIDTAMFRYQYYLSVVSTEYAAYARRRVLYTNQYAVTEQPTDQVNPTHPPGIFFKYDIEPIGLRITERRVPFLQFVVRLVNALGGVVVCTGWAYPLLDTLWTRTHPGQRRESQPMLDVGKARED